MRERVNVFWFRRDLRLVDNHGLHRALTEGGNVLPIFIFDTDILDKLPSTYDRRVDYIHQALSVLQQGLRRINTDIQVYIGKPLYVFKTLCEEFDVGAVYCNGDYEPAALKRDATVETWLKGKGVAFKSYKDQVIFEKYDVLKKDGKPYTVYTPYSRVWKSKLSDAHLIPYPDPTVGFVNLQHKPMPTLAAIGFQKTDLQYVAPTLQPGALIDYDKHRDFPALDSTTRLGIALRFGTISIRECVSVARAYNETWLNELIWREFFMQILFHFPHSQQECFKPAYEAIPWRNDEVEFARWCNGETGYALVDAGMRELNETGFMHNRVRMLVASFLTKHLLIDWRWGEAYFAAKLLDYDASANVGNWQWAAGCGCDAAPYFRIFNPEEQLRKFDRELLYVKRWNPDFESKAMNRVVDHVFARERALKTYKEALAR